MFGTQWCEHQGRRYLLTVYGPDPLAAVEVMNQSLDLLRDEPDGSLVRILIDVRETTKSMTGWPLDAIAQGRRSSVELAQRFELRIAAVGIAGPFVPLMRGMSLLSSRYKIAPAPTIEKAIEYLMRR